MLLLVTVLPVLESITLPELSTMRVLDPDVPLLPTDELLEDVAFLLTEVLPDVVEFLSIDVLPLCPDRLAEVLPDPLTLALERPTLFLPLVEVLYVPELLPDLLLLNPE